MKTVRTAAVRCVVLMSTLPGSLVAAEFTTTCGDREFVVVAENRGRPLDNVFTLYAVVEGGRKRLYYAEEGGFFHAACLRSKKGNDYLVFQSYCGGSACIEAKYGVVDPSGPRILLSPSRKNKANDADASRILGVKVPFLPDYKAAFCCGD